MNPRELGWRQVRVLALAPPPEAEPVRLPRASQADYRAAWSLRNRGLIEYSRGQLRRTPEGEKLARNFTL